MVYYGLPAFWGPRVEEIIVGAVHEQVAEDWGEVELEPKPSAIMQSNPSPAQVFSPPLQGGANSVRQRLLLGLRNLGEVFSVFLFVWHARSW